MLKLKDRGEPVKVLQRGLNRLGCLLLVDGDFGRGTESAVTDACIALKRPPSTEADDSLVQALNNLPEPSADLTAPGVTFIAREEITSPAEYRRRYKHPVFPPEPSGITIGIGYDLKFVDRAKLQRDWSDVLSPAVIDRLAVVSGKTGSQQLLAQVADVEIPLLDAVRVFLQAMVPDHVHNTRRIYPSLDGLPTNRRTALISLVFNRGSDLTGERRREMHRIQELLSQGNLDAVAAQFEEMTRLWQGTAAHGLVDRRRREATLWRDGFAALQLA